MCAAQRLSGNKSQLPDWHYPGHPPSLRNRKTRLEDDFSLPLSQGKDMYLILENDMLSLVDPMDRSVLHSQPIVSIRVWGVGRDNGR